MIVEVENVTEGMSIEIEVHRDLIIDISEVFGENTALKRVVEVLREIVESQDRVIAALQESLP